MSRKNGKHAYNKGKKSKLLNPMWIISLIIIVALVFALKGTETVRKNMEIGAKNQNSAAGETADPSIPILTPDSAIVTSAEIIEKQTTTGTAPFDSEEGDGNDTSAEDNIVRSFDQVTWTLNAIIGINRTEHGSADAQTTDAFRGGKIYLEATLPESNKGQMHWDSDAMSWSIGTGVVSDDGLTFTASYQFNENELMPQSQKLVAVLQVDGAKNKTQIQPTFRLWMEGNETDETKSDYEAVKITANTPVVVSAKPSYNIALVPNTSFTNYSTTVNFGSGDVDGSLYGYGIVLQLYNADTDKGLKGIEYPNGNITFDINTAFSVKSTGNTYNDITNQVTPQLWNYKIAIGNQYKETNDGVIAGRKMFFANNSGFNPALMPYAVATEDRSGSIYNSGNISMTQDGNIIHVTVSGYEFDGIFPTKSYSKGKTYTANIGCFNAGYFQIFVPQNDTNTDDTKTYRLTVKDENLSATSISGVETTKQEVTTDDSSSQEYSAVPKATYSQGVDLNYTSGDPLGTRYGLLTKQIGEKLTIRSTVTQSNATDKTYVRTLDRLIKFDGEAFELDGDKYTSFKVDSLNFKGWYVTKKDGTTWTDTTEMINANIEDLDVYDSLDSIPEDKLCVGLYIESQGTNSEEKLTSTYPVIWMNVMVKNTAKLGQTYAIVEDSDYWTETLDRTIYSKISENLEVKDPEETYPTSCFTMHNKNYIKTEYDENGEKVVGTHPGQVVTYGNSVLIVGTDARISIDIVDKVGENTKTNYNLDNNENVVTYQITPELKSESGMTGISGVAVVVKETIDGGLEYLPGQSSIEPDSVEVNEDGTTTITWTINNCTVGENITPITFKAKIDEDTPNNTQYTTSAVIEPDEDAVGRLSMKYRTATSQAITVINLASKRLYEEVEEPIIEQNGIVKYTVTYTNKDEDVDNFQLLNILPYNGDSLGTSFNGTYTLKSIKVSQTDTTSNDNLTLYVTNSDEAKSLTSEDTSIGTSSIWSEKTIGATLNEQATAFAIKGSVKQNSVLKVEIELQTDGNRQEINT